MALLALCATIPAAAPAHPGIHEQEQAAEQAIADHPRDPARYLIRGKLYLETSSWDQALEAFGRARELGADEATVATLEGDTFLAAGWLHSAKRRYDVALQHSPGRADARVGRARVWARLGHPDRAEVDFAVAFDRLDRVEPSLVLERRAALLAAGRPDRAIELLDTQIASVGLVPALQVAAIDIDVEAKRYDDALRRIDSLLAQSPGHPLWASRRAEILSAAGRNAEAEEAYREALSFVEARSAHRNSRRLAELEGEIRKALASSSKTRREGGQ